MNFTMSSYANNSFHTIFSSLISHSSLTVLIMLIGDREYLISFLLFPSGMKHRFSIQINIVHTCKINIENYQQNMNAYISVWYIINFYVHKLLFLLRSKFNFHSNVSEKLTFRHQTSL